MYKQRLIKFLLILLVIYGSLRIFDSMKEIDDKYILEKTLLLTVLVTFSNFLYPTL